MTDVIVPLPLPCSVHAPLQSHAEVHDFGSFLHPQLQLTVAPSPVAHASISQHPSDSPAPLMLVNAAETLFGVIPGESIHSCDALPSVHSTAPNVPAADGAAAPHQG